MNATGLCEGPAMGGGPWTADLLVSPLPPVRASADAFARTAIRAICGASVTPAVAQRSFERCVRALAFGATARTAVRHPGKAMAIDIIWRERERLAADLAGADDPLAFLQTLPGIGPATRRRLAVELGFEPVAAESERAAA